MIPDRDILAAIVAHRKPIERRRLAGLLGIDDDAELAATLARLTREGALDRITRQSPGDKVGYCYWVTGEGKRTVSPAEAPDPAPTLPPVPLPASEESVMPAHANSLRAQIIQFITHHPDCTAADVAGKFNLSGDRASQELWLLKGAGEIHVHGEGRPNRHRVGPGDATPPKPKKAAAKPKAPRTPPAPKPVADKPASAGKRARTRGRRTKSDVVFAPPTPAPMPPSANGFRVALTSDDTLLMERPHSNERVELQRHEIGVLTAFLRRLDSVDTLPR